MSTVCVVRRLLLLLHRTNRRTHGYPRTSVPVPVLCYIFRITARCKSQKAYLYCARTITVRPGRRPAMPHCHDTAIRSPTGGLPSPAAMPARRQHGIGQAWARPARGEARAEQRRAATEPTPSPLLMQFAPRKKATPDGENQILNVKSSE